MNSRRFVSASMAALSVLGVITMSAAPAFAANATPASTTASCDSTSPAPFTVTGAVGDTFTVSDSGQYHGCSVGINGAQVSIAPGASANLGTVVTATRGSAPNFDNWSFVILGPGTFAWNTNPNIVAANVTVVIASAPSPTVTSGIAPIAQAVGLPSSGSCTDVKDSDLSWGTGLTGGWAKAWEPWVNSGNGGWACRRVLAYDGSAWGITY